MTLWLTWVILGLVHIAALAWAFRKTKQKQFDAPQALRGLVLGLVLLGFGIAVFQFLGLSLDRTSGAGQALIAIGALLLGLSFKPKPNGMAARALGRVSGVVCAPRTRISATLPVERAR